MFDSECLVEVDGIRHEVSVELVEVIIKERCEVLWQILRFLKTRPEPVSKCSDVRNVLVFADFRLFLHKFLELSIVVCTKQPLEHRLLNLLIVFLLKEFIVEKLDRSQDEEFPFLLARVKRTYWSVGWKADGST